MLNEKSPVITVFLDKPHTEEDLEKMCTAISMMKGVIRVEPKKFSNIEAHWAGLNIKNKIYKKLLDALEEDE